MRDAVICSPVRTPVGRMGGALRTVDAETLAATVVTAIIERTGIDPAAIDDCVFGQCYPNGETPAIGRLAALRAGLPIEVPGMQLDRRCGSGLQAICLAAMQVQTGVSEVVLVGGVESMSNVEHYTTAVRWGPNRGSVTLLDRLDRARVTASTARYPVLGGMLKRRRTCDANTASAAANRTNTRCAPINGLLLHGTRESSTRKLCP